MYTVGTRKDDLIRIISKRSDKYGNGPGGTIEFMDKHNLFCLQDATVEQLEAFVKLYDGYETGK